MLWSPENPHSLLWKRLLAKEGDWLTVPDRQGYARLPKGRCWIEGDNPAASRDSATAYGPVPLALIEGRALAVIWPPSRCAALPQKTAQRRLIKTNDPVALAQESV